MVFVFALLSAFSFGSADYLGGLCSRKNPVLVVVAWSQAAGLLFALLAIPFTGAASWLVRDLLWGVAAGICGAAGVGILFRGLAQGQASIVSPLAALVGAVIPVLFGFLLGERPPVLTWTGVFLAFPAIWLLASETSDKKENTLFSLKAGILSGVAFSGFFILIAHTGEDSGLLPLLAARAITVPLFFLIAFVSGKRISPVGKNWPIMIASGALDMLANIFYLLAARTGLLVIAVILTALYPAPTVLLQRIHLKEKLGPAKIAGLVIAITGAAFIGIGG